MSYQVPLIIPEDVFKKDISKKLNHKDYENLGYKALVENNYTYKAVTKEYMLNSNIANDVIIEIEFILKRIGFIQFNTLRGTFWLLPETT
jgi:hypothetical protein